MGPNSLMVVYVDPLGYLLKATLLEQSCHSQAVHVCVTFEAQDARL